MEWLVAHQFTLIGIIWMLVLGPAVGNYACSVVYRLPLGKTPFERHPFCGSCNADLKPIDLFPVLSWLQSHGKCRYCGASIPVIYMAIEIACAVIFIANFIAFGISEPFILFTAYGVFVVILAAIHFQQGWIAQSIFTYALICVALARTLSEGSIYPWFFSGITMLVLVVGVMRLMGNRASPFEKPWVWWFVLMGSITPLAHWGWIAAVYGIKLLTPKPWRVVVYAFAALALPILIHRM